MDRPDQELVEQCLRGDHGAWEGIVRQYHKRAYNLAYRYCGMTVFTAALVLGWMSSMAGIPLAPATLTNPSAMYYSMEELADDVYDRSVRLYYGVPHAVLDEIQFRIEQLRESS